MNSQRNQNANNWENYLNRNFQQPRTDFSGINAVAVHYHNHFHGPGDYAVLMDSNPCPCPGAAVAVILAQQEFQRAEEAAAAANAKATNPQWNGPSAPETSTMPNGNQRHPLSPIGRVMTQEQRNNSLYGNETRPDRRP